MKHFRLLLTYFTRIPIGYPYEYKEEDLKACIPWFPVVGIVVGLLLSLAAFLFGNMNDSLISSLLVWLIYLWLTGGLHLDGLADSADAFWSGRKRERMLEIMKDSHIGTFGVLSLISAAAGYIIFMSRLPWAAIGLFPIVGKVSVMVASLGSIYARPEGGMGKTFIEGVKLVPTIVWIVLTIAGGFILGGIPGAGGFLIALFSALFIRRMCFSKIGGMTGDTCGLVSEVSQLIFLLAWIIISRYI